MGHNLSADAKTVTDHPLRKPKFSDRERAAYDWLTKQYGSTLKWYLDYRKVLISPRGTWPSIIDFAQHLGWEG